MEFISIGLTDAAGTLRTLALDPRSASSEAMLSTASRRAWLDGAYTVSYVSLIDRDREIIYRSNGTISVSPPLAGAPTSHSLGFSAQGFQLTGGVTTPALPTLTSLVRTTAAVIAPGGPATYVLNYAHGSSIVNFIAIGLTDAAGFERRFGGNGVASGSTLSVASDSTWLSGPYAIAYVLLIDESGRQTFYRGDGTITSAPTLAGAPTTHGLNLAALGFQLSSTPGVIAPVITAQPMSLRAAAGSTASFSVTASGTAPLSYQWMRNGMVFPGATNATLSMSGIGSGSTDVFSVLVTNSAGFAKSDSVALSVTAPANPARLINLSVRTSLPPNDSFTLGFVVRGGSKPMLIRAAGPTLAQFGISDAHADPRLELFSGSAKSGDNDNWIDDPARGAQFATVGAFPFASNSSKDAALYVPELAAGNSSVRISGVGSTSGVVLAELYETTPAAEVTSVTPRLVNVSILKQFDSGLTAGIVVGGTGNKVVLVRAVGPSLASFGISDGLPDPLLRLRSASGVVIASNDNWEARDATLMSSVGAFALPPGSKDAALLRTLGPGAYTLEVAANTSVVGQTLLEVYEIP
ncbi:MAG: hypothetical protein NTV51_16565 [Verrucomicrobia bacterium]|nr:hypothetical protein [Verrucomicrobiota bacterium]